MYKKKLTKKIMCGTAH